MAPGGIGVAMYAAGLALWVMGPSPHGVWPWDIAFLIGSLPTMLAGGWWIGRQL